MFRLSAIQKTLASLALAVGLVFDFAAVTIQPESSNSASASYDPCAFTSTVVVSSVTQSGSNCIVKFTSGTGTWTVPEHVTSVAVTVVGGGGAGGGTQGGAFSWGGGGGGGGNLWHKSPFVVTPGANLTVVVGAGGSNSSGGSGGSGGSSRFDSITANGGQGGQLADVNGGGLGGGSGRSINSPTLTATNGNARYSDSGGGGAGSGGNSPSRSGGEGYTDPITGLRLGGGGGGGGNNPGSGFDGGADGRSTGNTGFSGQVNTGGGGGGADGGYTPSLPGGSGGSGVVIISFAALIFESPDSLVVSDSGPFTSGEFISGTWKTTNASGTARISTSAVLTQLALGAATLESKVGSVSVESSIVSNHANSLTLKAVTEVTVQSGVEIDVGTGDLTLWSDAANTSNANGDIYLAVGSSLRTDGGEITLGGGANPASDYSTGRYGVLVEQGSIDAGSGSVVIFGKSVGAQDNSTGVSIYSESSIVASSVSISGHISANAGVFGNSFGVRVADTSISASRIVIDGRDVSETLKTGIQHWGLYLFDVTMSAAVQGISLSGAGSNSSGSDIFGARIIQSRIDSQGGPLRISGTAGVNGIGDSSGVYITSSTLGKSASGVEITAVGKPGTGFGLNAPGVVFGSLTSPTNLSISATAISQSSPLIFETNGGDFQVSPIGSSFTKQFRSSDLQVTGAGNYKVGPDASNFTTLVDKPISTSGDITLEVREISVSASISSTLGSVTLKTIRRVVIESGVSISTTVGNLTLWSDSDSNGDGAIEINPGGVSLATTDGDILLAGGLDANSDGIPDGQAKSNINSAAVYLGFGYRLETGSGDIILRGAATHRRGVVIQDYGQIISQTGKISISGEARASDASYGFGLYFSLNNTSSNPIPHIIQTGNQTSEAISLFGKMNAGSQAYTTALGSVFGVGTNSKYALEILAVGAGGGISVKGENVSSGTGNLACNQPTDAVNLNFARLETVDGDIRISGTHANESSTRHSLRFDSCASSYSGKPTTVKAGGSGKLEISANHFDFESSVSFSGADFVLKPNSTNFFEPANLTGFGISASRSFEVGNSTNNQPISLDQTLSVSDSIVLQGGAISSSGTLSGLSLGVRTTSTIDLGSNNQFSTIEVATSKASPTQDDIKLGLVSNYVAGEVSGDITGVFGVPKILEFLVLPASAAEDIALQIEARVGKDDYGLPLQANNRTPAAFAIAKAAGTGSLTGTLTANVLGNDTHTFSDLVVSSVPNGGSSISFTISGTDLTSTTSGLIHFFNMPSGDATLSNLGVGAGSLSPAFGSATRSYQVTVPSSSSTITLTPTANNSDHQQIELIYFGGSQVVTSGAASTGISLSFGVNTIRVDVTAENGSTSSYTVSVFRQLSQIVDWDYSNVSITEPNGNVSTASAFTDMYGDARSSALADSDTLDEDGLPKKTITIRVGEKLYLPMTTNMGNSLGYGGISGPELTTCKIISFTRASDSRSGAYLIQGLRAGTCSDAFVTAYQRNVLVAMLTLGQRGVEFGNDGYFRTPFVDIVVERKEQLGAGLFVGNVSTSSTAEWTNEVTVELKSDDQPGAFGNKSYEILSGPCSVTTDPLIVGGRSFLPFATGKVTATGAGTCVVRGNQLADNTYEAHSESHTITFTKANQQLSFTSNVPSEPSIGGSYTPTATSSAMLPVTLTVTTGNGTVCTISSGVVSFIATGSCTIQAAQPGDNDYFAATAVTQTLVVGEANQSITFNAIPDKEVGQVAFRALANASSGLAVSFTTNTSNTICTVSSAGLVTIVGEGVCSITANQAGNAEVRQAQPITRTFTIRPEGSSAPFITAVSYGDGSLTATLIAPSYTGGLSILDYSLFAYDANDINVGVITGCDATATPVQCTVTGLTNGQPYTLKAAARTSMGLGNLSAKSKAVTPLANPQAVRNLTALAGDGILTITWAPPSDLGGGDFARFDIRLRPAGGNFPGLTTPSATVSALTQSSHVFTGLQNGVSYDVEMITITTVPASQLATAALQSKTARVLQTPFTKPNAPRNLAAFSVDNSVKIAFAYPDFDGGRPVSEYQVSVNGTVVCTPTQIQVCSVPMSTFTNLLSQNFVGGIGFQNQFGFGVLSTTRQIPISVVAVNEGGTSAPATTTYDIVSGSSTPDPGSQSAAGGAVVTNLPTISSYSKTVLQAGGDSFSIFGSKLDSVTELWLGNNKLSFVALSASELRVNTGAIVPGGYSLQLRGSFGVLTVQDVFNVIEGRTIVEGATISRTFVDGFSGRSTFLGSRNVVKLRSFVNEVSPGSVIKCYGSIPTKAKLADIRLAFKRADRVCDFAQNLNPNIEVVRTWVWKDGEDAWGRAQVRLTLFEN